MRLLVTIEDPRVVEQILTHLGLPSAPVRAGPAQPPPASTSNLFADTLAGAPARRFARQRQTLEAGLDPDGGSVAP
jgi:hypothetical protein